MVGASIRACQPPMRSGIADEEAQGGGDSEMLAFSYFALSNPWMMVGWG